MDNKISLEQGVWFLATCTGRNGMFKLNLEEYYPLFDGIKNADYCIGQLFYHSEEGEIKISKDSSQEILAFPVKTRI